MGHIGSAGHQRALCWPVGALTPFRYNPVHHTTVVDTLLELVEAVHGGSAPDVVASPGFEREQPALRRGNVAG